MRVMSDAETASSLFDELVSARATIRELEKRIGELEALQFTPTGDNHHNALKCPYCNPERIDPTAERKRREELEKRLEEINEDARDRDLCI